MHCRMGRGLVVLTLAGLALTGCRVAEASTEHEPPAHVEHIEGSELSRVTLSEKAIERIDLRTGEIFEQATSRSRSPRTCVPYSAVIYDPDGRTWIYKSDGPRTYVREEVVVDWIEGDLAVLASGPAVGTVVATVGVAELYGTEFEVGH